MEVPPDLVIVYQSPDVHRELAARFAETMRPIRHADVNIHLRRQSLTLTVCHRRRGRCQCERHHQHREPLCYLSFHFFSFCS